MRSSTPGNAQVMPMISTSLGNSRPLCPFFPLPQVLEDSWEYCQMGLAAWATQEAVGADASCRKRLQELKVRTDKYLQPASETIKTARCDPCLGGTLSG